MKYLKIVNFIIILNEITINLCFDSKKEKVSSVKKSFYIRNLYNEICNIKNCLTCDNRNECIKCKEGYELYKKRCYTKNCEIYGFCKFCDEYDCLKCKKGYKINYGICEKKEPSKKKFFLILFIILLILFSFIYLYYRHKKFFIEKIRNGKVIQFIHPKSGFYQLQFENYEEPENDITNGKIISHTNENKYEKMSPIVNYCSICENKNTYCIADCGCSICYEDYKSIKAGRKILCKIHKVYITSKISFKIVERSQIKGNALEKLGLKQCPICKINPGTESFNCGCSMKLCEKCFNDNVYILKYNQCPGCGKSYIPIKNIKKKKKSKEESI